MKSINKITIYFLSILALGISCDSEDDLIAKRKDDNKLPDPVGELTGSAGSADFSTYVAIGNSLTAGFMDAALYNRGQENSFPNLLANRFALAGGGEFNMPDIDSKDGFNASFNDLTMAFNPSAAIFGRFFLDLSIPGPSPVIGGDALTMFSDPSSVNNLGVPGMRLIEFTTAGYGTLNPYYTRFALNPASTSVMQQALVKQPTFMTFWLGNNDVLTWATGGGVGADGEADPANDPIPNTLVSTTSFNAVIDGSMAAMFGTLPDLQGVILNIPNVTFLPFFQAVKWNTLPAFDQATADALNGGYAGYNALVSALTDPGFGPLAISTEEAAKRQISFSTTENNAVVIVDDQLTDLGTAFDFLTTLPDTHPAYITVEQRAALAPYEQARQLKSVASDPNLALFGLPAEILTFSAAPVLQAVDSLGNSLLNGIAVPLGDQYTLTTDEIGQLLNRTAMFNGKIASIAATYDGLELYDANAFFTGIAANGGIMSHGSSYAPDFSPSGVFSTDGIHPNPAGYALLTNEIMNLIEEKFGSELPEYDVSEFSTVLIQ